jgi:hypothetical protein
MSQASAAPQITPKSCKTAFGISTITLYIVLLFMRTIGGVRNSDWQFSKRLIPTIQNPLANLDTPDNGDLDGGFPVSISTVESLTVDWWANFAVPPLRHAS